VENIGVLKTKDESSKGEKTMWARKLSTLGLNCKDTRALHNVFSQVKQNKFTFSSFAVSKLFQNSNNVNKLYKNAILFTNTRRLGHGNATPKDPQFHFSDVSLGKMYDYDGDMKYDSKVNFDFQNFSL
jgi:hypothetical protein